MSVCSALKAHVKTFATQAYVEAESWIRSYIVLIRPSRKLDPDPYLNLLENRAQIRIQLSRKKKRSGYYSPLDFIVLFIYRNCIFYIKLYQTIHISFCMKTICLHNMKESWIRIQNTWIRIWNSIHNNVRSARHRMPRNETTIWGAPLHSLYYSL